MMARGLGSEFVPRLSEGAFVIGIMRLPGTSLEESLRYNTCMEQSLLAAFPDEVNHVWSRCGTAEVATDPMGTEETDFFITFKPRDSWTKARTQDDLEHLLEEHFSALPGQRLSFTQPIEQRVNEMTSGVRVRGGRQAFWRRFQLARVKGQAGARGPRIGERTCRRQRRAASRAAGPAGTRPTRPARALRHFRPKGARSNRIAGRATRWGKSSKGSCAFPW